MRNERAAELVRKHTQAMLEYRRHIHAHPELSHEEKETAAYIAAKLREMGLEPKEGVGGYGVTAMIEGTGEGKCLGLRADFDALPIVEETGLPFCSQNPGVMHACGHDTHAAMLLGEALVLSEMRDAFRGRIKLVFQPAEEDAADCGARKMIADGVLEDPHVDGMFAQHVAPDLPTGKIAVRTGAMSASSDRLFITIRGKNSHGSRPEDGIDAIVIAAQVVSALQTIVSRNVGPLDSTVVTVGTIRGGRRYNVIADEVVMEGTCRNLDPKVRDTMEGRIGAIVKGVAESMGGSGELKYLRCYSPTINDPGMFGIVKDAVVDVLGPEGLVIPESSNLGGEDFSYFCEKVPCAFYFLGSTEPGQPYYPVHSGHMIPDEAALSLGMEVMVNAALTFLNS